MFFKRNRKENVMTSNSQPPTKETREEYFRVGATTDGRTTLTLTDGTTSMTLTMNQLACEQMIRMIRATYVEEQKNEVTEEAKEEA